MSKIKQKKPSKLPGLLLILGLILFVYWGYGAFENRLSYSVKASDEFKGRIDHVLAFLKDNYPKRYKFIRENVHLIADADNVGGMRRAHLSGASYATVGAGVMSGDNGLIMLISHWSQCPIGLEHNILQTKNCASVMHHEAMHHYHTNNNMYQHDPDLEHYYVYAEDVVFMREMNGDPRMLQELIRRRDDFARRAGL